MFDSPVLVTSTLPFTQNVDRLHLTNPNSNVTSVMLCSVSLIILAGLLAEAYAGPVTSRTAPVASTQYHATCARYAASIEQKIKDKTLVLGPGRRWPDEFTWSGGFYVTPDQSNAIAFGASFGTHCLDYGGVVIMEFSFDSSKLKVNPLGTTGSPAEEFWTKQGNFGAAIRAHVTNSPLPPTLVWSFNPLVDISSDDNPTSKSKGPIPPTTEQMRVIRKSASSGIPNTMWSAYDDLAKYDVVAGAVPMNSAQQKLMNVAVGLGMPAIKPPFIQVVLVTNTGKALLIQDLNVEFDITIALKQLNYVTQHKVDEALTKKQPPVHKAFYGTAPNTGMRRDFEQ
ncbi:hypothetical protein B0H19DRAFT_1247686 [Mycena capillaripes]|nr:hypothetical protein B0H19DRAFT_1247686 [Mycena capillaripes]